MAISAGNLVKKIRILTRKSRFLSVVVAEAVCVVAESAGEEDAWSKHSCDVSRLRISHSRKTLRRLRPTVVTTHLRMKQLASNVKKQRKMHHN
jgi:hypothetical protein